MRRKDRAGSWGAPAGEPPGRRRAHPRVELGRWVGAAACALFAGGCGGPSGRRIPPKVSIRDGVAEAQVPTLPAPLDPSFMWTFRVVRSVATVAAGSGEPLVFDPTRVLTLRDGDLLIDDPEAARPLVMVNPTTGSVVRRFGRKGRGPGELGGRVLLVEARDGSLDALDGSNRRIHRYTSEGMWLGDDPIEASDLVGKIRRRPGGGGYLTTGLRWSGGRWGRELLLIDSSGSGVRRLADLPAPGPRAGLPGQHIQNGRTLWTVVGSSIVAMWSNRPRVLVYDRDGKRVRVIRLPMTRRRLTDRDIALQVKRDGPMARRILRPGPIALTNMLYPVNDSVFGMLLSNLWRAAEDPPLPVGRMYWRLFTVRGAYLGTVEQPSDLRVLGEGEGALWVRVLDEAARPVLEEVRLARARRLPGEHGRRQRR